MRSGEEGFPWEGRRVGEERLRIVMSESLRESVMRIPLAAGLDPFVREYQAGLWALNCPMTMLSPRELNSG